MAVSMILASPTSPPVSDMGWHMLDCEEREGRQPIRPDNAPAWFDPSDWAAWPVLAIDGGELHIIAVLSAAPGALRRLLAASVKAGLSPVVVEPMGHVVPALMRKWGWICSVTGTGWDRREEWRPA